MAPANPGLEARYPMGDNAWLGLGLGAFLVALSVATLTLAAEEGDAFIQVVAWGLLLFGVGFSALGAWQLSRRPRHLVLSARGALLPGIPTWRGATDVTYDEIAGLGHSFVQNVGEVLVVGLRDGREVKLPLKWLPDHQEVARRLEARRQAAEAGDPVWSYPAWERAMWEEGFGYLATPDGSVEPIDTWEAWAERVGDDPPDDLVLVTGRPGPAVALGVSQQQVDAMLDEVVAAATGVGLEGPLDRRNLAMVCVPSEAFPDGIVLELFALLRRVHGLDSGARATAIEQHFADMLAARAESDAIIAQAAELDAVRDALVVEIHAADRVGPAGLQRDLGAGVVAVLALDHEHGVTRVPDEVIDAWGVDPDVLFDQALANQRQRLPEPGDEGVFRHYEGPLVSAMVLDPAAVTDTPEGCVLGVPHQDALMVIDSVLSLVVAGDAAAFCMWAHGEGHRPISPFLNIWWKGRLHPIDFRQGPDGRPTMVPPPDVFSEIMDARKASELD